jgi:hypothetical protein
MFVDFWKILIELFSRIFTVWNVLFTGVSYWGPFVLGGVFVNVWIRFVRAKWISNIKWTTLEVKLPKEIFKSPLAMEVVLGALYQTPKGKWNEWYFKGRVMNWSSLEIVSIEGAVRFFIRTNVIFKNVIEAQIYAQYPNAEVYEVPDYTKYVDFKGKEGEWSLWGMEYKLTKEDAYPIKTYVDYGLDKEGVKEEYKTDPMTSMIEFLGSIGKNEQIWIQILIQPTGKRFKKPGKWFEKRDWKKEGENLVEEIIKKARKRSGSAENAPVVLTKTEENMIAAIGRNISKIGFDCGIRSIYLSKGDAFNVSNIFSLLGAFRQYSSNELNGFKPSFTTGVDYPWQDYKDIRVTRMKRQIFDRYKKRQYFYLPYKKKPFVLNVEELATIYHFPGGVAETPTFGRVVSKKAEPPVNLPV